MSKKDNHEHGDAAEYLARVEWENQEFQRRVASPWYMVPKWKMKKVVTTQAINQGNIWRFTGISVAVACGAIAYFVGWSRALPVLAVIMFFGIFFWLAIRDASKPRNDDH